MGWFNQENFQFWVLTKHDISIRIYSTSTQSYLPHINFEWMPPFILRDYLINFQCFGCETRLYGDRVLPKQHRPLLVHTDKFKRQKGITFAAGLVAHVVDKFDCVDSQPPWGSPHWTFSLDLLPYAFHCLNITAR